MKRIYTIVLAALSMLSVISCTDDLMDTLSGYKDRIANLETTITRINEYYASASKIISALEDHDMIKSITPVKNNGSYLVTFASGQTLTLIQGIDGVSPNLGIRRYEDGFYYWTVQYGAEEPQWLLSSLGLKIRASGLTPQMKIEDGWWQYSYDGGGSWIRLCQASGEAGTSVFKNISVSDYFVTFTLENGKMFQLPTEAYFARAVERCESFAAEMDLAAQALAGVDTSMAVKSITQVMDGDELVGYKLVLKNGKEFLLRSGHDEQPFSFAIKKDHSDWMDYWQVKVGDGDYTWVLKPDGSRALASSMSGTPRLSVRDTMDAYYFVYSFYPDIDDYQWLRDSNGNLVAANAFDNLAMFKAVAVGTENVALTLSDGKTIYLPFYYETNPSITFTAPAGMEYNPSTFLYSSVEAGETYTVGYKVTNVVDGLRMDAIGMDGATVTNITVGSSSSGSITGSISFTTPATFTEATTRILVFMTWGSNVTMQVLEFENED